MENFIFHDIFATKNIDYLLAIVSLLMLVPFWKALSGKKRAEVVSSERPGRRDK